MIFYSPELDEIQIFKGTTDEPDGYRYCRFDKDEFSKTYIGDMAVDWILIGVI